MTDGDRHEGWTPGGEGADDVPYLSVVAPCYNEEAVIEEFYRRVVSVCRETGRSFEIVLVNDGSSDKTWPLIEALGRADPAVVAVDLARNHGHQLALTAGLHVCRGRRVLIIDADLQDPPELLPDMMQLMDGGADVVYGQRLERAGESWFKLATAKGFYRLIGWLTDVPIPEDTGDFRLISRRALRVLMDMPEQHRFIRGMVSWIGFHQTPIRYNRDPRFAGETKYPLKKMVAFAVDAITAFSTKPLQLATHLGLIFAVVSLGLILYALVGWATGRTVSGWASLLVTIATLGSLQLLSLGIFGAYLGRLYEQSKQRPLFIIRDVVRAPAATPDPPELITEARV